jgi:hypothetical protein
VVPQLSCDDIKIIARNCQLLPYFAALNMIVQWRKKILNQRVKKIHAAALEMALQKPAEAIQTL